MSVLVQIIGAPIASHYLGHGPNDIFSADGVRNYVPVGPWTHISEAPYLGATQVEVQDFAAHAVVLGGFHRRFMASRKVLQAWAQMVRTLDIEVIAPQHGALFRGKPLVGKFIDWCEAQECGADLLEGWKVPGLE
jgi:hypothetical protein